jgi:uncharacterized membrane protein
MEIPVRQMYDSSRWARLLYMILFAVLYKAAEFIMWIVVLFPVIVTLVTGSPNERALKFGKQLLVYVYGLWTYLTYNTEKKPFPFSDWPTTTAPPSPPQGGTRA